MRAVHRSLPVVILAAGFMRAQAPEINFDSNVNLLKYPDSVSIGEVAGVATNSKGDIFVYTRTGHPTITIGTSRPFAHGGSRLYQFDKTGKFVREIGKDSYGLLVAQQVRVDPQDNVWVVDQMSSMVIKFDPNGRVQLLLGRKSESERVPAPPLDAPGRAGRGPAGAGAQSDIFNRPTDVAWDTAGNIYVADGYGNNARVAKFDKNGKFVIEPQFEFVHAFNQGLGLTYLVGEEVAYIDQTGKFVAKSYYNPNHVETTASAKGKGKTELHSILHR